MDQHGRHFRSIRVAWKTSSLGSKSKVIDETEAMRFVFDNRAGIALFGGVRISAPRGIERFPVADDASSAKLFMQLQKNSPTRSLWAAGRWA